MLNTTRLHSPLRSFLAAAPCVRIASAISRYDRCSSSAAPNMLIADRNGTRRPRARSKRRDTSTLRPATSSRRQSGTAIPAWSASVKATASQRTMSRSSSVRGNFAIAKAPSRSLIAAFGRAPPRDEPGPSSRRRSSASSLRPATRSHAASRRPSSTRGGTRCRRGSARNGPPEAGRKRSAPTLNSSSTRSRKSDSVRVRGVLPSRLADRTSARRNSTRPQRSGAESPIAPKSALRVWKAPDPMESEGSSE